MTIRTRLTLQFLLLTTAILALFAGTTYYSALRNREVEFYALLRKEALTKANLFFEARLNPQTLQDIYHRNRKVIREVEVAIYDSRHRLLYHDAVEIDEVKETASMLDSILNGQTVQFYQGRWQAVGLKFSFDGADYALTAVAYDEYGYAKLDRLGKTLIALWLLGVVILWFSGRYLAEQALRPIRNMVENARLISATHLHLRLRAGDPRQRDELSELADTFNALLDRLENSFEAQRQFVSNVSHELRTPLAAMISELEWAVQRNRTPEEYQRALQNALADARRLARLLSSLLDLAKASYDATQIKLSAVRVDEALLDACQQVQQHNPEYRVEIRFEGNFEQEQAIIVRGNGHLLRVAFANLIENACKFSSPPECQISVAPCEDYIRLTFADKGIGIQPEDVPHVFTPFYRGVNSAGARGHGIGLPLTARIVELHQGRIHIDSLPGQGTKVIVDLPYIARAF
ncbi:MAG: HAMP domain-containing histidine kinase [Saprospiraceae bacterium]|nr:HAMP domain-containing histidine kinase [Saprospiraceae bacterium]MDW8482695.1 HAMP domain-containing sensor histidine kinase [Saprospiraceae bacterium]